MTSALQARVRDFRTFLVLLNRELMSYFYSPIGYIVMTFFLLAIGYNFYAGIGFLNQGPQEQTVIEVALNSLFFWIPMLLIFPLITMRTYADEFRMGTFEAVTTAPVRDWQVVLSKFFGAFFFYCMLWLPSLLFFLVFQVTTQKPAAVSSTAYLSAYLMLGCIGMFYVALGCLASSLTSEQINAAIIAFILVFGAFILGIVHRVRDLTNPDLINFITYFSSVMHMQDATRGIIDTRPIVYYLSMTVLVLAINFQVFQYRKWKA
jgi:ABC-2 type transport system permease protein